jgi:hypothetical protein
MYVKKIIIRSEHVNLNLVETFVINEGCNVWNNQ